MAGPAWAWPSEAPHRVARRPHLGRQHRRRRQLVPVHAADPRARRHPRRGRAYRCGGEVMTVARVLVIEDEANNLDVAQRIIRAAGHEALVAMDGQTGLDVARAERPDAILVDLLLPRIDGWTVTRTLRGEAWAARIPIIAVSALAMQQDRQRAIDAGCDDFVSKPYAPAELRAVLARFLPEGVAVTAGAKRHDAAPAPIDRLGTVLAVDDEPANLDLISRRLAALGCAVLRASSGEQALAIAEREHPD